MKTPTPTPLPVSPVYHNNWQFDPAYIDARMREARRLRSETVRQILADGWQALDRFAGRLVRSLTTSSQQPELRL